MLTRAAKTTLGLLLTIVGLILIPMPIPLGALIAIVGLSILASADPRVANALRRLRHRYRGFSDSLNRGKPYLPKFAQRLIEETEPYQPGRRELLKQAE